jgi:hypothetical protein
MISGTKRSDRLTGKTCIITVTGGSIGRASALWFAREGARRWPRYAGPVCTSDTVYADVAAFAVPPRSIMPNETCAR